MIEKFARRSAVKHAFQAQIVPVIDAWEFGSAAAVR
jgi:hypothetical protein